MRARAGDIVGVTTTDVIGHSQRFKHHLCVHEAERHFLFVNSRQYPDDYLITPQDCPGLDKPESFLSISRVLHVGQFGADASLTCTVSDAYLIGLFQHVSTSRVISDVDRRKVLSGLEAKLNA